MQIRPAAYGMPGDSVYSHRMVHNTSARPLPEYAPATLPPHFLVLSSRRPMPDSSTMPAGQHRVASVPTYLPKSSLHHIPLHSEMQHLSISHLPETLSYPPLSSIL